MTVRKVLPELGTGLIAALVIVAALPGGLGVVPAASQPASGVLSNQAQAVERGRGIVTEKCARCHATGLDDASKHEKALPFRKIVERYPSENLAEALAEGIVSGHPDMPVFVFQPSEIEAFLAYLNSLAPAARPAGR